MVAMAMDRCRHSPHFLEKPRSSINNSLWLLMSTDDLNPRIFGIIVEDSHFDEQSFGEFRDRDDGPVPARIVRVVLQFFGRCSVGSVSLFPWRTKSRSRARTRAGGKSVI